MSDDSTHEKGVLKDPGPSQSPLTQTKRTLGMKNKILQKKNRSFEKCYNLTLFFVVVWKSMILTHR